MTDQATITGDKELDRLLQQLGSDVVGKLVHKSLSKGITVLVRSIRAHVPAAITPGHSNKSIKLAIGRKNKRYRKADLFFAKAGVMVGGAKRNGAPHAHLLALGTDHRYSGFSRRQRGSRGQFVRTKGAIAYRGRINKRDFVKQGLSTADSQIRAKIRETFLTEFPKEIAKLRGR